MGASYACLRWSVMSGTLLIYSVKGEGNEVLLLQCVDACLCLQRQSVCLSVCVCKGRDSIVLIPEDGNTINVAINVMVLAWDFVATCPAARVLGTMVA